MVLKGTLVASQVKFSNDGLVKEKNRQLQGQSPYVVNAGVYYASDEKYGWTASILYNIIGKRIVGVGKTTSIDGNRNFDVPDSYEMPRNVIDLTVGKKFGRCEIKLGLKDLLNQPIQLKQFPVVIVNGVEEGREQITRKFKNGRTISLGLTMNL